MIFEFIDLPISNEYVAGALSLLTIILSIVAIICVLVLVYDDAKRRKMNGVLWVVLTILYFPILGLYMILRKPMPGAPPRKSLKESLILADPPLVPPPPSDPKS